MVYVIQNKLEKGEKILCFARNRVLFSPLTRLKMRERRRGGIKGWKGWHNQMLM